MTISTTPRMSCHEFRKMGGRIKADGLEHGSTGKRAEGMGAAAEDRDEHELARLGPEAELRRGDLLDDGDQRTADTAEERGYHVAHQQHVARRRSQIFEPRLVRLDRPQHVPERAFEVALHAVERRDRDHEAHIQDDVLEGLRREGKSEQAGARDADAVGTVGVVEHLLQQRPQHHREGEVEHAEEDFPVAHHEHADEEADDGR